MANYRTSRILPIILVVVIIIIAIASLVSLARVVFFSGSSTPDAVQVDMSRDALLDTGITRSVQMTVRGPIVADEEFYSYQIDASSTGRSLRTYNGYLESVVNEVVLDNSSAAYEQFVFALDKANLPKGEELEGDENDVRGICATGRVYEFAIINGSDVIKKLWTSTCKGSQGSLDASVEQLRALFTAQIPDSDQFIQKISL